MEFLILCNVEVLCCFCVEQNKKKEIKINCSIKTLIYRLYNEWYEQKYSCSKDYRAPLQISEWEKKWFDL